MLNRLTARPGSRRARRRKGRGIGSGHGRTCGRGQKGAGARSGTKHRSWYEGGQMPLSRRVPKAGFTNIFRVPRQVVNLRDLGRLDSSSPVDAVVLARAGLIRSPYRPVKLLGQGEVAGAFTLRITEASATARQKIEAAGGSVELVPVPRRPGSAEAADPQDGSGRRPGRRARRRRRS